MAANTAPIFVKNLTAKGTTWTNSDAAATKKTVTPTVGAEGARVHSIAVTTDDTTARDFQIFLNDGTTDTLLGTVTIPIGAGNTGSAAAIAILKQSTLLPWVGADGSLLVPTGCVVKMANVTQPTSAKTFYVTTFSGDY